MVDEEEHLAPAVVELGNDDRSANAGPVLIELDVVLPESVPLVEPVVRVHPGVAVVLVGAAAEAVRALPGDEVDRRRAAAADLGTAHGRGDGDRLNRVLPRPDRSEETVRRLVEVVLVADAVQQDVQERLGQPVDGRVAAGHALLIHADQEGHASHQQVARRRWDLRNLIDVECRCDRGGARVDQRGAGPCDRHRFRDPANREDGVDRRRNARLHPHIGDDGALESLERHGHRVDARRERGHVIGPGTARDGREGCSRRVALDDNAGTGDDAARRILDDAGNG